MEWFTSLVGLLAATAGSLATLLTMLIRTWRTNKHEWQEVITALRDHGEKLDLISKEVSLNAGKSVKDAVVRIDSTLSVLAEMQHAYIDNCGVASLVLSPEGQIIRATSAYYRMTGLSLEDAQDWGWRRAIHPDDLDALVRDWSDSLQKQTTFHRRFRYVHVRDGTVTPVEATCRPIHTQAGRLAGWVAWIRPMGAYTAPSDAVGVVRT